MNTLNCIHFTDLHLGTEGQVSRLSDIMNLVKKDLEKQAIKSHLQYHLVLFSGDLVYSGQTEEYTTLTKHLIDLWNFFHKKLDCDPFFLCVPGNHDICRIEKTNPSLFALKNAYFDKSQEINKCFWTPDTDYHIFIKDRFFNYTEWHDELYRKLEEAKPSDYKSGFLPGDFSARIEINQIKLGVVGLNSSFLHLSNEKNNELDINERQLAHVCDSDIGKWSEQSDINLLMTHHGKDWLHSNSLELYNSFINPPGRFFAHIFGHTHQSLIRHEKINGNQARRDVQGKSLFGMKRFFENGEKLERPHIGYNIIQFQQTKNIQNCIIWPRSADRKKAGQYGFNRDIGFELEDDGSFLLGSAEIEDHNDESEVFPISSNSKNKSPQKTNSLICERRKSIFSKENIKRLNTIEKEVTNLWKRHENPLWSAYHDQRHNLSVESAIYEIIPEDKNSGLEEYEWFALIAAVWLHEIGMVIGLYTKDKSEYRKNSKQCTVEIRNTHHKRAVAYIQKHKSQFKIDSPIELGIITNLCKYHRIGENVFKVGKQIQEYKQGLIYAYLRLALLIHRDEDPNNTDIFQLVNTPGISWDTKFHWLKIKWMKKFIVDHKEVKITIPVYEPTSDSSLVGFLPNKIIDDMQEEFSKIKDILIKGKISFFVEIDDQKAGTLADTYAHEMELIRSNIELEEKSSATEAYETILNTLIRFTESDEDRYQLILSYYDNIEKVVGIRPCHTLIGALKNDLSQILFSTDNSQNIVSQINKLVKEKKAERDEIKKGIQIHSLKLISQYTNILLYGFSLSVLNALEHLSSGEKSKLTIYVAECRGKTEYNDSNRMVYNDGLYYLEKLITSGFSNTLLIPDLATANLFKRGKIDCIFFGANGVDSKTGSFGHTCGHLAIAESAKLHNIPLYVIAEESKIHNMEWKRDLNRDIKWMPNYKKNEHIFSNTVKLNPREDEVDKSLIDLIITEKGLKTTKQIIKEFSNDH